MDSIDHMIDNSINNFQLKKQTTEIKMGSGFRKFRSNETY